MTGERFEPRSIRTSLATLNDPALSELRGTEIAGTDRSGQRMATLRGRREGRYAASLGPAFEATSPRQAHLNEPTFPTNLSHERRRHQAAHKDPAQNHPRLHKVILVNDDYTPREFVVTVLKAEFGMGEDQAYRVMMTAHRRGVCVVAVYAKDVAETKATRATEAGRSKGYPLMFTTEPEE
jgi:ATP-dependent Clp protease adaptor protein ClpS